jgi:hypothetical protein
MLLTGPKQKQIQSEFKKMMKNMRGRVAVQVKKCFIDTYKYPGDGDGEVPNGMDGVCFVSKILGQVG